MEILIGYEEGKELVANQIKSVLESTHTVLLRPIKEGSLVADIKAFGEEVLEKGVEERRGIYIDDYAYRGAMILNKLHLMICAPVYDEHSAKMTIGHNSTRIISVGSEVTGPALLQSIASYYISHKYDAGRHQVRVDMLNKLC